MNLRDGDNGWGEAVDNKGPGEIKCISDGELSQLRLVIEENWVQVIS